MNDLISRSRAIKEVSEWATDILHPKNLIKEDAIGILESLPSADRPTDEEEQLKFYYVESMDDYWIGRRLDNFYYADWHKGLGFVWSKSCHLPWGEHIVDENTMWKEHTYPSEPIEIPFTEWIVGFVKKYFAEPKTGEWVLKEHLWECDQCGCRINRANPLKGNIWNYNFCPNCGAKMGGDK